jgi:Zinc finger, C2H2 type
VKVAIHHTPSSAAAARNTCLTGAIAEHSFRAVRHGVRALVQRPAPTPGRSGRPAPTSSLRAKLPVASTMPARTAPAEPAQAPLFAEYTARYLANPRVRRWLMCREPEVVQYAETFQNAVSFACAYQLPRGRGGSRARDNGGQVAEAGDGGGSGSGAAAAGQAGGGSGGGIGGVGRKRGRGGEDRDADSAAASGAQSVLDSGDLMMFHQVQGPFGLGSLYNRREHHALAQLRESVGRMGLSTRPRCRRFATDLSADAIELLEFAWFADDSLIINCRRFRRPFPGAPVLGNLAIQGDILFFGVVGKNSGPGTPFKRMVLFERVVACEGCGYTTGEPCMCGVLSGHGMVVGVKVARFGHGERPPRNPGHSRDGGVVAAAAAAAAATAASVCRPPEASTISNFSSRAHSIDQQGSFYVRWFQRVPNTRRMSLWMEPSKPIAYQFLCGTREQTGSLASLFVHDLHQSSRIFRSDARFHSSLTNGAGNLGMLVSKLDDETIGLVTDSKDSRMATYHPELDFQVQQLAVVAPPAAMSASDLGCEYATAAAFAGLDVPQLIAAAPAVPAAAAPLAEVETATAAALATSDISLSNACGTPAWQRSSLMSSGNHASSSGADANLRMGRLSQGLHPGDARLMGEKSCQLHDRLPSSVRQEYRAFQGDGAVAMTTVHENFVQYTAAGCVDISSQGQTRSLSVGHSDLSYHCHDALAGGREEPMYHESSPDGLGSSHGPRDEAEGDAAAEEPRVIVGANGLPTCSTCRASFKKAGNLTRHIKTVHLKKRPEQCEHCPASFGLRSHLKRHVETVHNRSTSVQCSACSREFRTRQQLDSHRQQAHWGSAEGAGDAAQITCEICNLGFSQRSNLNRHMQSTHEGFRHSCTVCPRTFSQKFDLRRHMNRLVESGDGAHAQALARLQQVKLQSSGQRCSLGEK